MSDGPIPKQSPFIYLLNAMEHASQADHPDMMGYAEKRRAVLEYVAKLEPAPNNAPGATTRPAEPSQPENRRTDKPEVRTVRRKIAERGPCGYEETLLEIIGDHEHELADLRHAASQVAMPGLPQEDPNDVAADVGRILRLQRKPVSDDKPQTETPITDALDADVRLLPPEMQRAPLLQHARDLERDLHAAGDGDTWEAAYNRVMAELEALRNEPDRGG